MDVINNKEDRRFEIQFDDGALAYAAYNLLDGKVMFPHTVVPTQHEGQGIGSALARAALSWAREEKLAVVPTCSFFVTYMQRHPETQDLLDAQYARLIKG